MNNSQVAKTVLALVGAAYVALAVWCIALPRETADSVGFEIQPGSGQSEYLVVYGGLQVGLGLLFLQPLFRPKTLVPMLEASLVVHGCLVAFRTCGFLAFAGIGATTYAIAVVEWLILLTTGILWYRVRNAAQSTSIG
ncbi:MAG: hypothetical protein NT069_17930 [Planctomycetota bacterium]|nr:hypothetical protein [Planctomycetota bacterium]